MESVCKDLFFGSGVVTRMLKQHSSLLFVNDLENYAPKNDDDIQDGERVFYCYENALSRILEKIELCEPVLSNFENDVEIY